MPATEIEDVLNNLDRRLATVEQIMLTLATKDETKEMFAEAERLALVLFERTQEQLEIIAAYVADISQRLPPRR